jgi:hypothetical protein
MPQSAGRLRFLCQLESQRQQSSMGLPVLQKKNPNFLLSVLLRMLLPHAHINHIVAIYVIVLSIGGKFVSYSSICQLLCTQLKITMEIQLFVHTHYYTLCNKIILV